uniref:Uncharacterized protein n=1 Tax=Cyprinus carpio TaxID=7962 RepID=A0A8C2CP28_CYPCA
MDKFVIRGEKTCEENTDKGTHANKKSSISSKGRKLLEEWKNQFAVNERDGQPFCLLFNKILGERAFKITSLEKNGIVEQNKMRAILKVSQVVTLATFKISWLLSKHGRPFSDGELVKNCFLESQCLFDDLSNKSEIIFTRRISEMSENLTEQLKTKLATASALSLAADESTDIGDVAQLCIWVRCVNSETFELKCEKSPNLLAFHCIVHQQALCSKLVDGYFVEVMNTVVKMPFTLLGELDSAYGDLILHSEVRWLSRGKVLHRFLAVLPEIVNFLNDIGEGERFPVLRDNEWKTNVAFLSDVTAHQNKLNLQLQGDEKHVDDLLVCVESFKMKLGLYTAQLKDDDLTHFTLLNDVCEGVLDIQQKERFVKTHHLLSLWKKIKDLAATFGLSRRAPEDEPVDVQARGHSHTAQQSSSVREMWRNISGQNLTLLSSKVLFIFGSTYFCKRTFSAMTHIKSRFSARLTDCNVQSQLHCAVTPFEPNFTKLVCSRQHQVSH